MEEKDREIWVGKSSLYIREDNILFITIIGDTDKEKAVALWNAAETLFDFVKGKVNVLVDLSNAGKQSAEARKVGKKSFENEKNEKVALLRVNPVARIIASFVMGVTRKEDIRLFTTEKDALDWLKN
ncbi:STAS/SEC14 domain-containing protein [Elusimicrobiota bacterium]